MPRKIFPKETAGNVADEFVEEEDDEVQGEDLTEEEKVERQKQIDAGDHTKMEASGRAIQLRSKRGVKMGKPLPWRDIEPMWNKFLRRLRAGKTVREALEGTGVSYNKIMMHIKNNTVLFNEYHDAKQFYEERNPKSIKFRVNRALDLLADCGNVKIACAKTGIGYTEYYGYIRSNPVYRQRHEDALTLWQEGLTEKAREHVAKALKGRINPESLKTARWALERGDPKRFGNTRNVVMSGPDGGPVQVDMTISEAKRILNALDVEYTVEAIEGSDAGDIDEDTGWVDQS